jgi:hypothetical protein
MNIKSLGISPINVDINALILDYLTMEGYSNSAANFSKEANLEPQHGNDTILARRQIKRHIHGGRIQEAIEALNDLDPEILDDNHDLHFSLLRLQLIELIRICMSSPDGDITPALDFATTHLSPRAPTEGRFLEDLEKTMALLVFPHDSLEPQLAELLHPDLRRDVADHVNKAIMARQCQRREAALRQLVRMRAWAEQTARDQEKSLPQTLGLGLGEERDDNSHDIMIT